MEELLPEVSYTKNGLYNRNISPNRFATNGGKYLLIHKSAAHTWIPFAFRITICGDSNQDACFIIDGNTQGDDTDGSCIIWYLYGPRDFFKILWRKKDGSIEVYLTINSTSFGNRFIFKESVCYTETNTEMKLVDSIDEGDFKIALVE